MKWVLRSLLIAAIAILGFWLWTVFFPNPEKAIRKQLDSLAQTASIKSDDGAIVRLAAAHKIPEYFSPDSRIILNIPQFRSQTLEGREDISEAAALIQSRLKSVKIEFLDLNVTVGLEKKTAQVELTAKITFPGDEDLTAMELKLLLKQIDGQWLITRVENVQPFN